jgi:plasmid stabilization system protein ParE
VIALSPEAEANVDRLIQHYEAKERRQAAVNLLRALEHAKERIAAAPKAGLPAPALTRP